MELPQVLKSRRLFSFIDWFEVRQTCLCGCLATHLLIQRKTEVPNCHCCNFTFFSEFLPVEKAMIEDCKGVNYKCDLKSRQR